MRPYTADRQILPGVRVIRHLRRGEDLDVYDCWSETRYSRCIVKALRPDRRKDHSARRALVLEGRLLLSFSHPHVVRAYQVADAGPGGPAAIVLETLAGVTLSGLLGGGRRLTLPDLAHLGRHLCSALRYIHDRGYLHLDLKPSNLIADGGRAKVIDLSLARTPGSARAGRGTATHMSPEQARGGRLSVACDVWGVGLVLYEAATGHRPFGDAGRRGHPSYPQLTRPAPPVRSLRRLPARVAAALDACLDADPGARPGLADLDECLTAMAGGRAT